MQKFLNQKYPGNPGQNEKAKSKVIDHEESENSQPKGLVNIVNRITEENFPNLKKEMPMNIPDD